MEYAQETETYEVVSLEIVGIPKIVLSSVDGLGGLVWKRDNFPFSFVMWVLEKYFHLFYSGLLDLP